MDRVVVLLLVITATGAFSAWWKARDGRVRANAASRPSGPDRSGQDRPDPVAGSSVSRWSTLPVEAADIAAAVAPASPLVFVEFTAPNCQPCVATREVLDRVTAGRSDVGIVALDVAEALDLVRAHRVMRAPTTLLITEEGHLLGRVSGVPREDELLALLDSTAPQPA